VYIDDSYLWMPMLIAVPEICFYHLRQICQLRHHIYYNTLGDFTFRISLSLSLFIQSKD